MGLYKPKLTSALLDSDKVLENLKNLEEKVQKEMFGKERESELIKQYQYLQK